LTLERNKQLSFFQQEFEQQELNQHEWVTPPAGRFIRVTQTRGNPDSTHLQHVSAFCLVSCHSSLGQPKIWVLPNNTTIKQPHNHTLSQQAAH
jgi:hypothetical protein